MGNRATIAVFNTRTQAESYRQMSSFAPDRLEIIEDTSKYTGNKSYRVTVDHGTTPPSPRSAR